MEWDKDYLEEQVRLGKVIIAPTKPGLGWVKVTQKQSKMLDEFQKSMAANDKAIKDLKKQVEEYLAQKKQRAESSDGDK
jgi:Fe-S cluster biosynthesis and repair protein YggX